MYIHLQYDNGDPSVVNNRLFFYLQSRDEHFDFFENVFLIFRSSSITIEPNATFQSTQIVSSFISPPEQFPFPLLGYAALPMLERRISAFVYTFLMIYVHNDPKKATLVELERIKCTATKSNGIECQWARSVSLSHSRIYRLATTMMTNVCVCCTEVENLKRNSLKIRIHAHIHLLNQESERYYQFCVECVY